MKKREQIEPHPGDVRWIRRNELGQFTSDQVDRGRSLSRDNDQQAKRPNPGGQGDRGDGKKRK